MQPYTYPILSALFEMPKENLLNLISKIDDINNRKSLLSVGRSKFTNILDKEDALFDGFLKKEITWEAYAEFCAATELDDGKKNELTNLIQNNTWNLFISYYANTYFGVRQSLQLDTLREFAETLSQSEKTILLASVISVMTFTVSSTTHLAQYLKPSSFKTANHLILRRQIDIINEVGKRLKNISEFNFPNQGKVHTLDFSEALPVISPNQNWVVYADPPYFKEHYSRYYHVLDTFYLYDYPELTFNPRLESTTIGRYREKRLISDFGKKSKVYRAFETLFHYCKSVNTNLVLSYAETSLVKITDLVKLAEECGLSVKVKETLLMHSGQGQPRNKVITEYLLLCSSN